MKTLVTTALLALGATALSGPAFAGGHLAATGDASEGEKAFRQCQSCHVVVNDAGETLAGRASKTGPNLYNIAGRTPGSVEGFRYGKDTASLADSDVVFDEATFVAYVQDPTAWLREVTGNSKARSKMAYKVRKEEDALNLYAFLQSLGSTGM